jgi:hypothetical protein
MLELIEQCRRFRTVENAKRLPEYFERNPSRIWVLRGELLRIVAAVGVQALKQAA